MKTEKKFFYPIDLNVLRIDEGYFNPRKEPMVPCTQKYLKDDEVFLRKFKTGSFTIASSRSLLHFQKILI